MSFLCGGLHKEDVDDYKKAAQVIKYLRGTQDLPLNLSEDGTNGGFDASFAVFPDMKGRTGGALLLGRGSIYSMLTKKQLVARSLT